MSVISANNPIASLRADLKEWIDTPNRSLDRLARWLQGYDLLGLDPGDEPYVKLLRAIPVAAERAHYEGELARSAASLVAGAPSLPAAVRPRNADEFWYNALWLCAGLRAREILSPPLRFAFESNVFGDRRHFGLPLNDALRSALIANQADNSLEEVWERIASGEADPVLGGTPHDGFLGALHMPPSSAERGSPAVTAIGSALTHLARQFTPDNAHRVGMFRIVLKQAMDRYPGFDWKMQFIRYSDDWEWPDWTDVALPSLFITGGANHLFLWDSVADFVRRRFGIKAVGGFCGGRIVCVVVRPEAMELTKAAAEIVEDYRRRSSFGGQPAVVGVLSAALGELPQHAELHGNEASRAAVQGVHDQFVMTKLSASASSVWRQ